MAPALAVSGTTGDVLLTWLEPVAAEGEEEGGRAVRLLFSRLRGESWTEPVVIAQGDDFFANWADLPGVVEGADGLLWAHWLAKLGEDTYAYGVRLARSADGGGTWGPAGWLHDDASPTEHGFVAYAADPEPSGGVRAFWLDGRRMVPESGGHGGGPMELRTASLGGDSFVEGQRPPVSAVVDDRVCECCATDAAFTAEGPVVAYRDRSEGEIRDIRVARWTGDGGALTTAVHADRWEIPGCPVNGPAIGADGQRVAVVWFTAARQEPKVQAAFSEDGGATFGAPLLVDGGNPLGRVDLVLGSDGAWVSWLAASGDVLVRRLQPGVEAETPLRLGHAGTRRSAGVPRLVRAGDQLVAAWVQDEVAEEGAPRLRVVVMPSL
jgi:hypothetical protein